MAPPHRSLKGCKYPSRASRSRAPMPSRCPPSLAPSSGCPQGPLTLFTGQQRPCSSRGGAAPGGGAAPKRGWFGECGVLRPEWLPASWRRGHTSPRSATPRTERGATRPNGRAASPLRRASNGAPHELFIYYMLTKLKLKHRHSAISRKLRNLRNRRCLRVN